MQSIMTHTTVRSGAKAAMLGLALITLVNCSSGDDSTTQVTGGGSAGLQGPMVFVNNTGDKTLTSVALKGGFRQRSRGHDRCGKVRKCRVG